MLDNERLELAGPLGVIVAVVGAEFGAHALAYWPASPLLWWLDLQLFRPLQYGFLYRFAEQEAALDGFAQTLCVALPLLALICIGLLTKVRLPLAVASNISLLYSALLLYGSYLANSRVMETGMTLGALLSPSGVLAGIVLLLSFLSSAISHRAYWREILSAWT